MASDEAVKLDIPTLRLTYKVAPNDVRIVIYRWSIAQQTYFQVTSVTAPLLNDPSVDSVDYTDTLADTSIVGNAILYTTGGVVENIAPPATDSVALYKNRLFLINAENRNQVWYSKPCLDETPVEMSDLFTRFVAPTSGAQGSTGILKALAPMDDKLIFFKSDAAYYMTGNGPDIAGGNDDFSEPTFITSAVGTNNQQSVVLTPIGLQFQSGKGIWILDRGLQTSYIGAPVEAYNDQLVTSATSVPATNQVRFTLEAGTSSTLYMGYHTILNRFGQVVAERLDQYIDSALIGTILMYDYYYQQWGSFDVKTGPVLMSFETGWLNFAGVQGFQRAYWVDLIGNYITPHKLAVQLSYDYALGPLQSLIITPDNYSLPYGVDPIYGAASPYGGPNTLEQYQIFLKQQKGQAFKMAVQEVYDGSYDTTMGAGLTFSGLNFVVGLKKAYSTFPARKQVS